MKPMESGESGLSPSSAKETPITSPPANSVPLIMTVWNH